MKDGGGGGGGGGGGQEGRRNQRRNGMRAWTREKIVKGERECAPEMHYDADCRRSRPFLTAGRARRLMS